MIIKNKDELLKKLIQNNKKRRLLDDTNIDEDYKPEEDIDEDIDEAAPKRNKAQNNVNKAEQEFYKNEELRINQLSFNKQPLKYQILSLDCSDVIKLKALQLLSNYEIDRDNNGCFLKAIQLICKIKWNTYHDLNMPDNLEGITDFLENAYKIMNEVIYGQNIAKMEILEYLVSSSKSRIIGLTGSAGVGKTTLIKNALSKCFNNRPFYYISLGGITDVKILAGSAPVWKGSTSGRLVDALIETQCMNPIIYFDEVDKVGINSNIHEYLIHLIDPVYNTHIYNNFLDINIDFSKVMFVFSYNNKNLINKILLDRIKMVEMKDYTKDEMVIICEKYIIPQILDEMKMPNNLFNFDTDIIRFINTKITDKNKSMRPVIRLYQDIISKIYMNYIINRNNKNTVLGSLYKMNIKIKNGSINITEELINNII
jgi:ATP-dependent Lon protease